MLLPQGSDYLNAVQNPQLAFDDIDLKNGTTEKTPFSLPKPYSGGFTTTFKLERGNKSWAVRCFTRPLSDIAARYEAISRFISGNNNPYFVNTKYLRLGIRLRDTWYPVIKMKWVNGEPLNRYIQQNIHQPQVLVALAKSFRKLISDLGRIGISHGDLQHGNILVIKGNLFLIDYDGIFLPDIAYLGANNIGHPNYQHPGRQLSHFTNKIDHFSSILIYTALLAVSSSPTLWQRYNNDENILFRQQDLLAPDNSPLFQEIRAIPNSPVSEFIKQIQVLCEAKINTIPSLDEFIQVEYRPTIPESKPVYQFRSPYPVVAASDSGALLESVGQRVEVVGKIAHYKSGPTQYGKPFVFLNFTHRYPRHTFTVVIWSEALAEYDSPEQPLMLVDQWVSVIGVIDSYVDRYGKVGPQILLEVPTQMSKLQNEAEARAKMSASGGLDAGFGEMRAPSIDIQAIRPKPETVLIRSEDAKVFNRLYGTRSSSSTKGQPSTASTTIGTQSSQSQEQTKKPGFWRQVRKFLSGK